MVVGLRNRVYEHVHPLSKCSHHRANLIGLSFPLASEVACSTAASFVSDHEAARFHSEMFQSLGVMHLQNKLRMKKTWCKVRFEPRSDKTKLYYEANFLPLS